MVQCILPENFNDLRNAIYEKGGFAKLREMTADERVQLFARHLDVQGQTTSGEWFNREIERRILKGNESIAINNWLNNLEKKGKTPPKKDLLTRLDKKKDVFNPKDDFYAEKLAQQALGFGISKDDAKSLYEKSATVNARRQRLLQLVPNYLEMTNKEASKLTGAALEARIKLGEALVDFQNQYEAINLKAQGLEYSNKSWLDKRGQDILAIAGNIKSLVASVDTSFFRQIQNAFYVDAEGAFGAWLSGQNVFWNKDPEKARTVLAEILTRPNALNGNYNEFGIEVGIKEEAYPESWISKALDKWSVTKEINVFARSENAFNIAIQTARANLFDTLWENCNGDKKLLHAQKVGEAISIITGRGTLPLLADRNSRAQRIINNLMFAPKWLASRIQTLTDLYYIKSALGKEMTPYAIRGRAAIGNVLMIGIMTALSTAWWYGDDDDERKINQILDPRSSDFGKLTIGRTRFDLSTGTAGIITLLARIATGTTVNKQGTKDAKTKDVFIRWLQGKSSPGLSTALDLHELATKHKITDYSGYKTRWALDEQNAESLAEIAMSHVTPIAIGNVYETYKEWDGVNKDTLAQAAAIIADFLGVGTTTYSK